MTNKWIHAPNLRLTTDRTLTNSTKFGKRALSEKLVKNTWSDNEDELLPDWYKPKEVLVGIFPRVPMKMKTSPTHAGPGKRVDAFHPGVNTQL